MVERTAANWAAQMVCSKVCQLEKVMALNLAVKSVASTAHLTVVHWAGWWGPAAQSQ